MRGKLPVKGRDAGAGNDTAASRAEAGRAQK
jgi:hypothetical protein